jgi:hypothetical protein
VSRPEWRIAAASVCGASHERLGLPCQDAHKWAAIADSLLVVAIADGAGSALLAEVGAGLAVGAAVDSICERLGRRRAVARLDDREWQRLMSRTLAAAKQAIETEAESRSLPARDFACTLTVAVAGADFVAAVQVGDGAIVVAEPDGGMVSVTQPIQGDCLNETLFLTAPEALESAQPALWRGTLAHLAAFSDGLQMTALHMPGAQPHPGFFTPLFQFLGKESNGAQANEALTAFLTSPRLRDRTDDDVTLFVASLLR